MFIGLFSSFLVAFFASCPGGSGGSDEVVPSFSDVTSASGIGNVGRLGQSASWVDFDGDGWLDLITGNTDIGTSKNVFLFRNNGNGTFSDVVAGSGIEESRRLRSVSWGDFDNDGLPDLAAGTIASGAPPLLYKNLGEGFFLEVSSDAGITRGGGTAGHVLWVDYDVDGFLDLFQANINSNAPSFLYRNRGDGTFEDVSDDAGLGVSDVTNSAVWFDANNDGFPDLFLANEGENRFYVNRGDGTFLDRTVQSGLGGDLLWDSVSACAGDFNNDGFLDLYVVNISSPRNALYRNNGDGTFTDITLSAGVWDVGDGRTCAWVDFDGDGLLDLFTTNHTSPSRLFRNLGDEEFEDVAVDTGIDLPIDVFSATWGDFNRDGFMDVFLTGHLGSALMQNDGGMNNFLILWLVGNGVSTNTSAIGTRVWVFDTEGFQVREVSGGRGCCEQDMLPVHFGLGGEREVDVVVDWTDGSSCVFNSVNVQGGRMFFVFQDGCRLEVF